MVIHWPIFQKEQNMADVTCQEIFGTILPERLDGNEKARAVDALYVFDITGDDGGKWTVDLRTDADQVKEGETEGADCTITMTSENFVKLWTGSLAASAAYMFGKLKVKGDMGLALKLQTFIG